MDYLNSTGFAEIGAEDEKFYGGNKKEDGISDFGAIDGEECGSSEEDIYLEINYISILDREYEGAESGASTSPRVFMHAAL